ncbi:MAG TPA: hypothetical protein EYN91_21020 [Candidatus Melainabacteria bacterium]|nr:hypothetical protein [Candidatus Melainabacteria bacterium]HIN65111.1 hypothetical protein [Candidatus Obscuribacterales bacterium]
MRHFSIVVIAVVFVTIAASKAFAGPVGDFKFLFGSKCTIDCMGPAGIKVGEATRNAKGVVYLPLRFSLMGSGDYVKKISFRTVKNEIYLCVERGVLTLRKSASGMHDGPVRVGKIPPGDYQLFYSSSKNEKVKISDLKVPE